MSVILNSPRLNSPVIHEHGTPEGFEEDVLNNVSDEIFKQCQNAVTTRYLTEAARRWKTVPHVARNFKEYCVFKEAILSELDRDGGAIRGLIEKGLLAQFGAQPQNLMDEAVETAAGFLNTLRRELTSWVDECRS